MAEERGDDVLPEEEEKGNPLRENEVDNPRGAERPESKRREKDLPRKSELDLGGKFHGEYFEIKSVRYERGAFSGFR